MFSSPRGLHGAGANGHAPSSSGLPPSSGPAVSLNGMDLDMDDDEEEMAAARRENGAPRRGDDEAEEDGETGGANGVAARRKRQAKIGRNQDDVPRVRDETGERVREKFEEFLETCVSPVYLTRRLAC